MARGRRRKPRRPEPGDQAGVQRARAELEYSQARLEQTQQTVGLPLAEWRSRNNVIGMVNRLMHDISRG